MKETHTAQQGFTLIEVLVALTLMALVSLISWRGLDAVQRTGDRLDEHAEETLSLVRALGQIEQDVQRHAGEDVLSGVGSAVADARSGTMASRTARMPAGIVWDATTGLHLVRAAGDGLWQQVRWYLDEGKLIRAVGAPTYLLPLPVAATRVVVLEDVSGLTVRMWQANLGWVDPPLGGRDEIQGSILGGPVDTRKDGQAKSAAAKAAGQGIATGLEIALYRQGSSADQPYRKVMVLP